jgi:ankyrin repeat protein
MVCKNRDERLEMIRYFLENGADKHHKNNAGRSPLDMAIKINYQPLLEILDKN